MSANSQKQKKPKKEVVDVATEQANEELEARELPLTVTQEARVLCRLEEAVKKKDEALKRMKSDLEERRETFANRMAEEGLDKLSVDGRTVYPRTDLFARLDRDGLDDEALLALLEEYDMGDMLKPTVNGSSFKGAVRELVAAAREENDELIGQEPALALPERLRQHVKCFEKTRAMTRAS